MRTILRTKSQAFKFIGCTVALSVSSFNAVTVTLKAINAGWCARTLWNSAILASYSCRALSVQTCNQREVELAWESLRMKVGYTMVKIHQIGLIAALISCSINIPSAFAETSVSQNSREQIRTTIQPLLSELGYYSGPIDGINGPKTRLAILKFEFSISDNADGYLNSYEMVELKKAVLLESSNASAPSPTVETQSMQDIESLKSELAEANQTVERERVANAKLTAQLSNAESDIAELRELQAEPANEELRLRAQVDALNNVLAELAESKSQLETEVAELETLTEQLSVEKERSAALEAQVNALNNTVTDYVNGLALDEKVTELEKQKDAANEALVDLRKKMESDFVPKKDLVASQEQVAALNSTLADMRVEIDTKYISLGKHQSMQAKLLGDIRDRQATIDSLNKTLADSAARAEARRARQVSALNGTIVELQEKIQLLDKRKNELWTTLNSFLTDCKNSTACALELGLN